jgi:hypothetical protein
MSVGIAGGLERITGNITGAGTLPKAVEKYEIWRPSLQRDPNLCILAELKLRTGSERGAIGNWVSI